MIEEIIKLESRFHQPGVGYNEASGLTYDGIAIDPKTGELMGPPRNWSAASKEALHIQLLSMAVADNDKAGLFISPEDPAAAKEMALSILKNKIESYEKFNDKYPGFAGFLPWFLVSDEGLEPAYDWLNRVPGLDNGQLAWALFQADYILSEAGERELAQKYRHCWNLMAENAVAVFYEPLHGKVRAEAAIGDTSLSPGQAGYSNNIEGYYLEDPYEGELLVLFMDLFGNWANRADIEKVWNNKLMESATYVTKSGERITVRKGHWYSSHEMWNFLVLPYTDVPLVREVFLNGEKARTHYSMDGKVPGLFASVHEPAAGYASPGYASAAGVPSLAKESVDYQNFVTPYAAFPVIIADRAIGLEWYRTMVEGRRMKGPYGSTESVTVDGENIASVLTWDGKILPVAAFIVEEIMDEMREALKKEGVYDQFTGIVSREYESVFSAIGDLEGTGLNFALPAATLPPGPFDPPADSDLLKILEKAYFMGGGDLYDSHLFDPSTDHLQVFPANGWIYTNTMHFCMEQRHLKLVVRSTGGGIFVEFKNLKDKLMTDEKIAVEISDTGGEFTEVFVRIPELTGEGDKERTLGIFGLSDSSADIEFKEIVIMPGPPPDTEPPDETGDTKQPDKPEDPKQPDEPGDPKQPDKPEDPKPVQPPDPDPDSIIYKLNFDGVDIKYSHEETVLKLYKSGGYIWSHINPVDISANPLLVIDYAVNKPGILWLELKNDDGEKPIAYDQIMHGHDKIKLHFQETAGRLERDLSKIIDSEVSPIAVIIVFSDPDIDIEIYNLMFKPAGN